MVVKSQPFLKRTKKKKTHVLLNAEEQYGFLSGQANTWKAKAVLHIICKRGPSPLLTLREVLQLEADTGFALGCLRYKI